MGDILSGELMAYIGDISKFDNISKLWQYAGYGMNRFCDVCKIPMYREVDYTSEITKKKTRVKKLTPTNICPFCNNQTKSIPQKRMKGYQINWNSRLRTTCWKLGQSFLKRSPDKSGYRRLYDVLKPEIKREHPMIVKVGKEEKYTDGHIHNMTLHKVVKIFLSHYWTTDREFNQLEVTKPYAQKYLDHDMLAPFTDE